MPYRVHFRSLAVMTVFTLVVTLALFIPGVAADGDDDQVVVPEKTQLTYPKLGSELDQLATSGQAIEGPNRQSAGGGLVSLGGSVAVTIHLSGHVNEVVAFMNNNGGDPRNVGEDYIEAYVPITLLGSLSEQPGVLRVRKIIPPQPTQLAQQILGNGPEVHGSMPWNEAGYGGRGIKVGIIDDFNDYDSLMGTELPSSVVARCYTDIGVYSNSLSDCLEFEPAESSFPQCLDTIQARQDEISQHGTWVAEAVVDLAPDVTLYIANPPSRGDMQETADWMASQGVSVINYSAGWIFDGPGDGTSPLSVSPLNTVDRAVASDVLWVNSAGNAAEDTWFDSFYDPDGDGAHGFNASNDEVLNLGLRECSRNTYQLRWEDSWTAASTDLDLHLYHIPTRSVVFSSDDVQAGNAGDVPWEALDFEFSNDSINYGLVVTHASGPVPDWIQITAWTSGSIEHHTLNGSINNPAESVNPGMLAVGAAPWFDVNTIEVFSSRGPTPDGRTKPDIVGADCGESALLPLEFSSRFGGNCGFAGTSQASPHVAGMAALVRQRFPDFTAQQVAAYLKHTAEQRESSFNNTWGHGFAKLTPDDVATPEVPLLALEATGGCTSAITGDGFTIGDWTQGCGSQARIGRYAKFYTFTLAQASEVSIRLESATDPYLYLRSGEARAGGFLHRNDDHEGDRTVSLIEETLAAGTYTIEATTYRGGETGSFTLTVSGLAGGVTTTPETDTDPDPDQDQEATGPCGATISGNVSVSGQWSSACESQVRIGRYAKFYTFTLAQASEVSIRLESETDPYLYLRRGAMMMGTALHRNDDHEGDRTVSLIEETLAAGTYTIEATTYRGGETGTFTLMVSGLGGGGTTMPETDTDTDPDPDQDQEATGPCGATISGNVSVPGQWSLACDSQVRIGRYAKFYTFTLAQASEVSIRLESATDPYLYLRNGEARAGGFLHRNDDHEGDRTVSLIEETLVAGTYTIEATTYRGGETGTFTLMVSGLGGDGTLTPGTDPDPDQDQEATGPCGATISGNVSVPGQWSSACDSQVRIGRYAKFYTFTLAQASEVSIRLESATDPYLYLRSGEARAGGFLHRNDDHEGDRTVSLIEETLAAGTYTIEATTYRGGETGSFTLTVSGLGGDGTLTPGTEMEPEATDACGATISSYGAVTGQWTPACESQQRSISYAKYHTFSLEEGSEVSIRLESDTDPYLYLRRGESRSGDYLHQNDDHEGSRRVSQIDETLTAGTYTIEATTYNAGESGSFTLTISLEESH